MSFILVLIIEMKRKLHIFLTTSSILGTSICLRLLFVYNCIRLNCGYTLMIYDANYFPTWKLLHLDCTDYISNFLTQKFKRYSICLRLLFVYNCLRLNCGYTHMISDANYFPTWKLLHLGCTGYISNFLTQKYKLYIDFNSLCELK